MGFSFQGIHSKEKKLKARITGYPMLPAFRNNTESIPGRSGILDFGMEYSERIIPVKCSVFPEQDFYLCTAVDRFDFVLRYISEAGEGFFRKESGIVGSRQAGEKTPYSCLKPGKNVYGCAEEE